MSRGQNLANDGWAPGWLEGNLVMKSLTFSAALVFFLSSMPAGSLGQIPPEKSVRVGDNLVAATRVWVSQSPLPGFPRYHRVVVEVTVKNVSQRISHTHIPFPRLKVKPDYEYEWDSFCEPGVKPPNLNQLPPGEESRGGYAFDVQNGSTPFALTFQPPWNPVARRVTVELAGIVRTESAR